VEPAQSGELLVDHHLVGLVVLRQPAGDDQRAAERLASAGLEVDACALIAETPGAGLVHPREEDVGAAMGHGDLRQGTQPVQRVGQLGWFLGKLERLRAGDAQALAVEDDERVGRTAVSDKSEVSRRWCAEHRRIPPAPVPPPCPPRGATRTSQSSGTARRTTIASRPRARHDRLTAKCTRHGCHHLLSWVAATTAIVRDRPASLVSASPVRADRLGTDLLPQALELWLRWAVAYDKALADRIRELLAADADLSVMKIFGGLAFLVGGNMAVAASGQGGIMVRVDPASSESLVATTRAHLAEMRGRPMQGWLRVDTDDVRTKRALATWVQLGATYARSLPPKR
jgi:hypothetical protein